MLPPASIARARWSAGQRAAPAGGGVFANLVAVQHPGNHPWIRLQRQTETQRELRRCVAGIGVKQERENVAGFFPALQLLRRPAAAVVGGIEILFARILAGEKPKQSGVRTMMPVLRCSQRSNRPLVCARWSVRLKLTWITGAENSSTATRASSGELAEIPTRGFCRRLSTHAAARGFRVARAAGSRQGCGAGRGQCNPCADAADFARQPAASARGRESCFPASTKPPLDARIT